MQNTYSMIQDENVINNAIMPFKIGFEFQESSGLFNWGLDNYNIQKQPIFSVSDKENNRKLFHVEIDGEDIEFVTPPFTHEEKDILTNSIAHIKQSISLLNSSSHFYGWMKLIQKELSKEVIVAPTDDKNLLSKVGMCCFTFPKNWEPQIAPQVTLQHPLGVSIPLYFSLFGFSGAQMLSFSASVPFKNSYLQTFKNIDLKKFYQLSEFYTKPIAGLCFLHSLTLTSLTPLSSCTEPDFISETSDCFSKSHQVDAKIKLNLLSRRPFSELLKSTEYTENYTDFFYKAMGNNRDFLKTFEVPLLFKKANYGEQFFDHDGRVISLAKLLPLLMDDFVEEVGETNINKLLNEGIITTTMLRNLKIITFCYEPSYTLGCHFSKQNNTIIFHDICLIPVIINTPSMYPYQLTVSSMFRDSFYDAIHTVQQPNVRYEIDINGIINNNKNFVIRQESKYDNISPPNILDISDSMGNYKDSSVINKEFGEAIVEIRNISSINPWLNKFLLKEEEKGRFLTQFDCMEEDMKKLFYFLANFGKIDKNGLFFMGMRGALEW